MPVDVKEGLNKEKLLKFVQSLNYKKELEEEALKIVENLYTLFINSDALMIEINPLATVKDSDNKERVLVIDSKVSIDENAKFRQKELDKIIDTSSKNEMEKEAEKFGLNFIHLDGNIGCLVNGAGKILF